MCSKFWPLTMMAVAQTAPAYSLEWQRWDANPMRTAGVDYTWNGSYTVPQYSADTVTTAVPQHPDSSGADWNYAHINLRDSLGNHIGYVAVGYTGFVNWGYTDGCYTSSISGTVSANDVQGLQRLDRRKSQLRGAVVRYDLEGNIVWHKPMLAGVLFDVLQDSNGDLVICGEAFNAQPFSDMSPAHVIKVNPTSATTYESYVGVDCSSRQRQFNVLKLDVDGNVLWDHFYNMEDDPELAIRRRGSAYSLVEREQPGGWGYRVVGNTARNVASNGGWLPFVVDIDQDGFVLGRQVLATFTGSSTINDTLSNSQTAPWCIASLDHLGNHYEALTGYRRIPGAARFTSYLYVTRNDTAMFFKDTNENSGYFGLNNGWNQLSTSATFAVEGANVNVVWPVLTNVTTNGVDFGSIFANAHQSEARVYKFDIAGNPLWTSPAELGVMRAFDLRFDGIQTSDGELALSSSKWSPGFAHPSTPYNNSAFSSEMLSCLLDTVNGYGYALSGAGAGSAIPVFVDWDTTTVTAYGYWNTDSYVAKIALSDGHLIWEQQWDEGTGDTTDCWPGNFRKRQCNFTITEADDGGLVVCGNTGHNFDDAYLAKLRPCDQHVIYANLPLNGSGQFVIASDTTWSTDMNVKGSFVVNPGVTLTVDGATIGFADSRQVGVTTNLHVRTGGTLRVAGGAHLTSAPGCAQSMWDGIKSPRDPLSNLNAQSLIVMENCTISNALTALYFAEGDPADPYNAPAQLSIGRIRTDSVRMVNNLHDIVMIKPGGGAGGFFALNVLQGSDLLTTSALNYAWLDPQIHIGLRGIRGFWIRGCTVANTSGLHTAEPARWGTGLLAHGSRPRVVAWGSRRGRFEGLSMAVRAMGITNQQSLRVDRCDFIGNARGISLTGVAYAQITRNTFEVPDLDVSSLAIAGTYGTHLFNCTGFGFEGNTFTATGSDEPKVGAVFNSCGPESNRFYNNRFDGFTGNGTPGYSAGSIIMGNNDGPSAIDGLKFKCNDFSNDDTNDYDAAFTGSGVMIGDNQGSILSQQSPAGNTFADTCIHAASHLFVEGGTINAFQYVHHNPGSTALIVLPTCYTSPPIQASWFTNSFQQYDKPLACPPDFSFEMQPTDNQERILEAEEQMAIVEEAYADWKDGGSTEGLLAFIEDTDNDSYAVRNELMLVAPSVSQEAWAAVFGRESALNDWHLMTALVANSPLEDGVLQALEEYDMPGYLKGMVYDAQTGGTNLHVQYKSELAHFHGEKAVALHALTAMALLDTLPALTDTAFAWNEAHGIATSPQALLALALDQGDLQEARLVVDAALYAGNEEDYWVVQDLLLALLEDNKGPEELNPQYMGTLMDIATNTAFGAGQAMAWLHLLGVDSLRERIDLPHPLKRGVASARRPRSARPLLLEVFPNPGYGPFNFTYVAPEGVEQLRLTIVDATGRLVAEHRPTAKQGMHELKVPQLATGLHLAALYGDGIPLATARFTVIR